MTYYDGTHNLWTITDPDDNTSTFTYDNNNNVLTTEDSLGHQVVRTYDGNSLLLPDLSQWRRGHLHLFGRTPRLARGRRREVLSHEDV